MAVVPTSSCTFSEECAGMPQIGIFNSAGTTNIIVDIFGYYDDGTLGDGLHFHPMSPVRITDTRSGLGAPKALGPSSTTAITAPSAVLGATTEALALNVTAVTPSLDTFFTLWPSGLSRPLVSNLNPSKGASVCNASTTILGPGNVFDVFNNFGTANLVIDVQGAFDNLYVNPSGSSRLKNSAVAPGKSGASTITIKPQPAHRNHA
jgi:hypothetical protein